MSGEILYTWGCFPARRDGAGGAGVWTTSRCSQPWPRSSSQCRAHRADPLQSCSPTTISAHHADEHSQDFSARVCWSRAGGRADRSGAVTVGNDGWLHPRPPLHPTTHAAGGGVAAGAAGNHWWRGCGIRDWHATRIPDMNCRPVERSSDSLSPSSVFASASFVPSALKTLMLATGLLGGVCFFRARPSSSRRSFILASWHPHCQQAYVPCPSSLRPATRGCGPPEARMRGAALLQRQARAEMYQPPVERCLGRPRVIPIVSSTYTRGTLFEDTCYQTTHFSPTRQKHKKT